MVHDVMNMSKQSKGYKEGIPNIELSTNPSRNKWTCIQIQKPPKARSNNSMPQIRTYKPGQIQLTGRW